MRSDPGKGTRSKMKGTALDLTNNAAASCY